MIRPSIILNRLIAAAATAAVLVLIAAGRAAALVPDPDDGRATTGRPLPAPPASPGTSTDVLWIAVTVGVVALVAAVATALLVERRRTSRRITQ